MQNYSTIRYFTDLEAWKEGHKLVIMVYRATKGFPSAEMFGLISQLQRAVVSVTSNIAEGFGRTSPQERVRFYRIGLGSLYEVHNQLLAARDVELLRVSEFTPLLQQLEASRQLLHGLIRTSVVLASNHTSRLTPHTS